MRKALRAIYDYRRFTSLPPEKRAITFYAEDGGSWAHLGPLVESLTTDHCRPVSYLTSSLEDPVLQESSLQLNSFFIGTGTVRTLALVNLHAAVCVMTMPDIETFHLKRSRRDSTHYVYVFHSMVSTHMIYRPTAFDHYDSILCVGPHHVAEIREREQQLGQASKSLVEYGYGRLDAILHQSANLANEPSGSRPLRVLVAPTWAPEGLLEGYGTSLITALANTDFEVVIRPHPETVRRRPDAIEQIRAAMTDRMTMETEMASRDSLLRSDVMVSDWSGAALEYAFGTERPVLFIDVPRKINNPDYEQLEAVPLEVSIRQHLGAVLAPDRFEDLPRVLTHLVESREEFRAQIRDWREHSVFHPGASAAVGANYLARMADGRLEPVTA